MFKLSADTIICNTVKNELNLINGEIAYNDNHEIVRQGVAVELAILVEDTSIDKSERYYLTFVFCPNVSVWYFLNKGDVIYLHDKIRPNTWVNSANHTSGWRSDGVTGVLNDVYFDMCKKVNPEVAPVTLHHDMRYLRGNMVSRVILTYKPCDDYYNQIISIDKDNT